MASGIHRSSYTSARPPTPNTENDPLGIAPGATVTVYNTGFLTTATLFTDQALTNPLANPFNSDVNGFYSYYVNPVFGDVDEQFSGLWIITPYTLTAVLDLDPRIGLTAGDITTLGIALTTETAQRIAADNAITAIGSGLPLGGSFETGIQNATRVDAYDPIDVLLNGTTLYGYFATVYVRLKTGNAGTSVTAVLRNVTDGADAGTSTASVSTTGEDLSFVATLVGGVKLYRLQLIPQNGAAFIFGSAYIALTK
jgi:hypothetical protein